MIAAIYARKSTDETGVADEAKSITRQIYGARAFATARGWTVSEMHIYADDAISGVEFANRPAFIRLMNALKPRPTFNVLVMSEESRVLYRELYCGRIVWNRTQKRDQWGQQRQHARPEAEWLVVDAPQLRIVTEAAREAAHARLAEARSLYLRGTRGELWGNPGRGTESKYLLVGLARCGICGAGLSHVSGTSGRRRSSFYVCTAHHGRGDAVCSNNMRWSMEAIDRAALDIVREQVLSPAVVEAAAVRRAMAAITAAPATIARDLSARSELDQVEREIEQFTAAIALGGDLASLVDALKTREVRKRALERRLSASHPARPNRTRRDLPAIADMLRDRLREWHGPLTAHTEQARQLIRKLMVGRLVVTPEGDQLTLSGTATLGKFFAGVPVPKGLASPHGTAGTLPSLALPIVGELEPRRTA